jgi:hypothetical protein
MDNLFINHQTILKLVDRVRIYHIFTYIWKKSPDLQQNGYRSQRDYARILMHIPSKKTNNSLNTVRLNFRYDMMYMVKFKQAYPSFEHAQHCGVVKPVAWL